MEQDLPSDTIIRFPLERVRLRATEGVAFAPERNADRIPRWVRRWLFRSKLPGAIQDIELNPNLTGQLFSVCVGEYFVRVRVDGYDYYFDRITGRFDGVGGSR